MVIDMLSPKKNALVMSRREWGQGWVNISGTTGGKSYLMVALVKGEEIGYLTDKDKCLDNFQKYYGQAIRGNIVNKEGMRNAILAIFDHCVADNTKSLDQQHSNVPKMDGVVTGVTG